MNNCFSFHVTPARGAELSAVCSLRAAPGGGSTSLYRFVLQEEVKWSRMVDGLDKIASDAAAEHI